MNGMEILKGHQHIFIWLTTGEYKINAPVTEFRAHLAEYSVNYVRSFSSKPTIDS